MHDGPAAYAQPVACAEFQGGTDPPPDAGKNGSHVISVHFAAVDLPWEASDRTLQWK